MDYVKVLSDLIAIDTTVPPGRNYGKAMDYLEPLFRRAGFKTQKLPVPPKYAEGLRDRVNLVGHRRHEAKPRLIFYAHIDVVPAAGWDAFKPRIEQGRVYGRGAADMKGGIVALLLALQAVRGRPLRYDTSVVVTTDEESGQADQLRYLKGFLLPVSGASVFSLDSSFGFVTITNLGSLGMVVRVKGRAVHSALSHLGENAVEKAVPLLEALLDLKRRVVQRKSEIGAHPSTGLEKMEARLNINQIEGGLKVNVVPDQCLIAIDRRLIPEENIDDAEKELMATLVSVPGVDWEIERIVRIPTTPPCRDPIVDELSGVVQQVTGASGKYGEMGSGDLPYIVSAEWGGREFALGVNRPECNIHGRDEFVYLKDIEDLARIITLFLT